MEQGVKGGRADGKAPHEVGLPQDDERKDLGDQQGVEERSLTIWAVYESQYQTDSKPKLSPTHNSHDGGCLDPDLAGGEPSISHEDCLHDIEMCA